MANENVRIVPDRTPDFRARVVPYSSIVGSSVILLDPDGHVIGQVALLNFGDRERQQAWAERLARCLNNGASAEVMIEAMSRQGLLSGAPKCTKPPIDLRAFVAALDAGATPDKAVALATVTVATLDKAGEGDKDGAAIRRDQETPNN